MFQKNWQELIKPQKLRIEAGHEAGKQATIVAEPLERGFGLTVTSIRDVTPIPHNGCRPPKRRRV